MPDFAQPVSAEFIIWTVIVILAVSGVGVYMVKKVTKTRKDR